MSVISGMVVWGNTIQDILIEWENMGIFEYVLPALLIFAIIFGILIVSLGYLQKETFFELLHINR